MMLTLLASRNTLLEGAYKGCHASEISSPICQYPFLSIGNYISSSAITSSKYGKGKAAVAILVNLAADRC